MRGRIETEHTHAHTHTRGARGGLEALSFVVVSFQVWFHNFYDLKRE